MTFREKVIADVRALNETQLKRLADYLNFLKVQNREESPEKNGNSNSDSLFNIGKNPVNIGVSDASENLDEYLY